MAMNERYAGGDGAARIIVESELTDWALARRKAAAELGLAAHGTPQPSDAEIIAEIQTWQALYGGAEWVAPTAGAARVRAGGDAGLQRFNPALVGRYRGLGACRQRNPHRADTRQPKEVEYALIDLDVEFTPHLGRDGVAQYEIVDGDWRCGWSCAKEGAPESRAIASSQRARNCSSFCAKPYLQKGSGFQTAIVDYCCFFAHTPYAAVAPLKS